LLIGSGDDLFGPLLALFQAAAYHQPSCCQLFCLSSCLFTVSLHRDQLLATRPPLQCAYSTLTPLLCVSFQFLVYSGFCGVGVSLPKRLCWFIRGVAGGILHDTWCSTVGLPSVSHAGLEPACGGMGALLFSQCKVLWRSFVLARGSGCYSFDSFWYFISSNCVSTVSARFLIFGAYSVRFCTLVAILDPPHLLFSKECILLCIFSFFCLPSLNTF
jgi:hypothetical protein